MKRKHEAKNDFFYAFVMFAMFAVIVFGVVFEVAERDSDAYAGRVEVAYAGEKK